MTCDKVEETDPEHTYKYFLNDNPWTWEQHGYIGDSTDTGDPFQKATTQYNTPHNPWNEEPYNRWNQEDEERMNQGQHRRSKPNPPTGHRDTDWRSQSQNRQQATLDEYQYDY